MLFSMGSFMETWVKMDESTHNKTFHTKVEVVNIFLSSMKLAYCNPPFCVKMQHRNIYVSEYATEPCAKTLNCASAVLKQYDIL